MFVSRLRVAAAPVAQQLARRAAFSASARQLQAEPTAATTETKAQPGQVTEAPAPPAVVTQAPNRAEVWSRSQQPRVVAMTGPRFEQTDFELQVGSDALWLAWRRKGDLGWREQREQRLGEGDGICIGG